MNIKIFCILQTIFFQLFFSSVGKGIGKRDEKLLVLGMGTSCGWNIYLCMYIGLYTGIVEN